MKVDLYNQSAEIVGEIDLPDKIFGAAIKPDLIKFVLDAQMANARHPLAHTKGRGEVRGGGKKPWRQKGTGRARHGSRRSPIWKGGGVTFGPTKEKNYSQKINKKTKRQALFMVLSGKTRDKEMMVVDKINFDAPKTKTAMDAVKILSGKLDGYRATKKKRDSILLVTPGQDKAVIRATNNLSFLDTISAKSLNIKDILGKKYLILLRDAVPVIEETYKI